MGVAATTERILDKARAGAHRICAEVGMNPRDRAVDTAKGRGLSVTACEQMLWEAGFMHERKLALD